MPQELSLLLRQTIDRELPHLRAFAEDKVSVKPAGIVSWSPKEELGHLIDSAANNHIRFVRAATQPEFHGDTYSQNAWVDIHAYQEMGWTSIVDFWYGYNDFLAALIWRIPAEQLRVKCYIGEGAPVSLRFLVEDYVLHMQHHLDHLMGRAIVTTYPATAALAV